MNQRQIRTTERSPNPETENQNIGTGKKVGLYGCGFLILAIILLTIFMFRIGYIPPFRLTEGVGP